MAAIITYRGATVLDAGEGTYGFRPGTPANHEYKLEPLARGHGLIAKDLGKRGATHSLLVRFVVPTASVSTIHTRISNLLTTTTGTLVIPDFGSYTNCLLLRAEEGEQRKVGVLSASGVAEGYEIEYQFTFQQLR